MDSSQRNRKKREKNDGLSSRTKRGPGGAMEPGEEGEATAGSENKITRGRGFRAQ